MQPRSELAEALRACRFAMVGLALFSGVINILMLTGSFFMLQVYDRVLPSRSVPTLIGLGILAGALFAFQGLLEVIRSRILMRVAEYLDVRLSPRVYQAAIQLPLRAKVPGDSLQFFRDLDQIRTFISSTGPGAFFDMPWMPIYIFVCFLFHFWIGIAAIGSVLILVVMMLLTEWLSRGPMKAAAEQAAARNSLAEASHRNAEVIRALGMGPTMSHRWGTANRKYLDGQQEAGNITGTLGGFSRSLRMALQSFMLGLGAYLAIAQEASQGVIIASSILIARALAPVELAIGNWQQMGRARQSWRRLTDLLNQFPESRQMLELPPPKASISVEGVTVVPPGDTRVVVHDASFSLQAGNGLGIIGPSASGKSSLARVLVGVWMPRAGKVRLDGASLDQWTPEVLGRHIGYLPQEVELFAGTIAQNISRFDSDATSDKIISAAKLAGVHDVILRLAGGYETQIGERGTSLSAGQRQRIALARALYGDPFLIVLDEPNSNLDAAGEEALTGAITGVRSRGAILIVVAHRPSALAGVDQVLVMRDGKVQMVGPKEEVLRKIRPTSPMPAHMKVVSDSERTSS